jgi:hypothetical protein
MAADNNHEKAARHTLVRGITRLHMIGLLINSIVGAGILGLPSKTFALVAFGPTIAFITGWLRWFTSVLAFATVCNLLIGYLSLVVPAVADGSARFITVTAIVGVAIIASLGRLAAAKGSEAIALGVLALIGLATRPFLRRDLG